MNISNGRWKKSLEGEAATKAEIGRLKRGEERVRQMIHTAQRELEPFNKKWREKITALVTGKDQETLARLELLEPKIKDYHEKKAKTLVEHQTRERTGPQRSWAFTRVP